MNCDKLLRIRLSRTFGKLLGPTSRATPDFDILIVMAYRSYQTVIHLCFTDALYTNKS